MSIKGSVINYSKGMFYLAGGGVTEHNGCKEFICMPTKEKLIVNKQNLWASAKGVYIPISQLHATINNIEFCHNVSKDDKIGFFDIETDLTDKFILGYVNEDKFTDPQKMVNKMKEYDVVVAYNSIRFDNEILAKYCPYDFMDVENAGFVAKQLKGVLMIDLMALLRNNVSLESLSAENVARSLGFNEEIFDIEDKDKKCQQDIRINRLIFERMNIPLVFNTISNLVNTDTLFFQMIPPDRLRKFIHINKYLRENLLPLKQHYLAPITENPDAVKLAKTGFYQNYSYYDITSTYPQTAINIGGLGVYGDGDDTFTNLQTELSELAKNQYLKKYMKFIANALIGSQHRPEEYFRNPNIRTKIVKTVVEKVMGVINERGNVIFSNTDCFVVPSSDEPVKIEGYEIKNDYNFEDLFIYSVNKWCGRTKDGVFQRGFPKLNSRKPKILVIAREEILSKLNKVKGKRFLELLDKPRTLVSKTLRNLKNYKDSYFKISIRKTAKECNGLNLEYSDIWNNLKFGWNDIYWNDNGKITFDIKKRGFKYYRRLVLELAEDYNTKNLEEKKQEDGK